LAAPRGSASSRGSAPPQESHSSPTDTPEDPGAPSDVALLFSHDLREPLQQIVRLVRAKGTSDKDTPTSTLLRRVLHCAERANGIGVPPGQAERIFGVRARLHTNDQIPGTGLGLALCRAIVQRHGGRMALESAEGQGSTFVVTLPRAPRETMGGDATRRPPAVL